MIFPIYFISQQLIYVHKQELLTWQTSSNRSSQERKDHENHVTFPNLIAFVVRFTFVRVKEQKHFIPLLSSQIELIRTLTIKAILMCNLHQINPKSSAQQFELFHEGPPALILWRFLQHFFSLAEASLAKDRTWASSRENKSCQKKKEIFCSISSNSQ